jgi:hypothetical protein
LRNSSGDLASGVAKGYRWAELSLTSADNPRTPQLAEHLGAVIYKRYRVYRRWLAGVPLDRPVPSAVPAAHPGQAVAEESRGVSANEDLRRVAMHDQAL